jgi:hypothetical protein
MRSPCITFLFFSAMRYKAQGFPSSRVIPPPFLFCTKTFQREISLQEKKRLHHETNYPPGDLIARKEKPLHLPEHPFGGYGKPFRGRRQVFPEDAGRSHCKKRKVMQPLVAFRGVLSWGY